MHVLSGLIGFIGGSFSRIHKDENGEIHIDVEIPFENIKSSQINRTTYSPKTKGNWKRTVSDGRYILSSPISGFRKLNSFSSSRNDISGEKIHTIRETMKNINEYVPEDLIM